VLLPAAERKEFGYSYLELQIIEEAGGQSLLLIRLFVKNHRVVPEHQDESGEASCSTKVNPNFKTVT